MKRLLFIIFVFLPGILFSQSFWNKVEDAQYSNKSHITDKGLFRDSVLLVSRTSSDASCPGYNLSAYLLSGQKLWGTGAFHESITSDSDFIYTAGYLPIDDVAGYDQIIISKYDGSGNQIFSIGYPDIPHVDPFYFETRNIDLTADGTIVVSSANSVVKKYSNDTTILEYALNLDSQIVSVKSVNPFLYLINTNYKIYKSDSSFNLTDSINFSGPIIKIQVINDTIYSLFNSLLIRLDTNLTVIDTLYNGVANFYSMEFYDSSLWLQELETDSIRLFKFQNVIINDTLTFPLFVNSVENIITGNNFVFAGNSFSNQTGICNFIYDSILSPDYYLPDIELTDFDISNIIIDYYYFQGDSIATGYFFNTTVTVKNNGTDTISGFSVFSDLEGEMNCAQNFYYEKFTNTIIFPGQNVTVNLNQSYQSGINNNELCFECLAPDSQLETIVNNNSLCKTFNITGIKEEASFQVNVYPNPVSDYLVIENSGQDINSILLTDITGKISMNKIVSGQKIFLETKTLKPGVYLLTINSGSRKYVQRVIKI